VASEHGANSKQKLQNAKQIFNSPNKVGVRESEGPIILDMNLRKQLARYLALRDLTLAELGRKSGVSKNTLHDWSLGQKARDVSKIKLVAEVLGTTVDHLCFGDGIEMEAKRATELDALLGEGWVSGLFEVRFRRVKR
jgi:transcriptional regulator with XRE-family HTH domain